MYLVDAYKLEKFLNSYFMPKTLILINDKCFNQKAFMYKKITLFYRNNFKKEKYQFQHKYQLSGG